MKNLVRVGGHLRRKPKRKKESEVQKYLKAEGRAVRNALKK